MNNQDKIKAAIQQLHEVCESAYNDGYSDGKSSVTIISHEITQHDSKCVGLRVVLSNGREVYFSESF